MSKNYNQLAAEGVQMYVSSLGYRAQCMDTNTIAEECEEYALAYAAAASEPDDGNPSGPSGPANPEILGAVRAAMLRLLQDPDFRKQLGELMSGPSSPSMSGGPSYPMPSTPGADLKNLHPTRQTPASAHIPKHEPYLGAPGTYGLAGYRPVSFANSSAAAPRADRGRLRPGHRTWAGLNRPPSLR